MLLHEFPGISGAARFYACEVCSSKARQPLQTYLNRKDVIVLLYFIE